MPPTLEPPSTATINNDGTVNEPIITAPIVDKGTSAPVISIPLKEPEVKETPAATSPEDDKTTTDDFDDAINAPQQHKSVPPKKKEDVPADKKDDKVVATDTTKKEVPVITKTEKKEEQQTTRDYTGVPDNIASVLKNTSNEAFNTLKPLVLEHIQQHNKVKEYETQLEDLKKGRPPENYQEHPQGYILSPEFAEAAKNSQDAEVVANHWRQQFDAIENGALKYNTITRDANGNLVLGPEMQAGADAKSKLLRTMNWADNQLLQRQGKLEAIKELHTTKYNESKQWLDTANKEWFTEIVTKENHPLMPFVNETLKSFPATFRANPMAKSLAISLTLNVRLAEIVKTLQENGGKLPTKEDAEKQRIDKSKKQAQEAGPTASSTVTATKSNNAEEDVNFDDFQKAMD